MYLLISIDGEISLEESDNMRAFSIAEEAQGLAAKHLSAIATPAEDNHFWLDAEAVIDLSGRADDRQWVDGFWDMLTKVEAYGYSDMEKRRVKAHLEQS
ncbi:MAG: hypothetical protein QNJ85_13150 [Gammaproteobacteria bacterium]|nr:hypothetical protein [Gammaproteobacteria bacterium]